MTEHTPWQARPYQAEWEAAFVSADGSTICDVFGSPAEANARAHLIAGAPELLEALEVLLSACVALDEANARRMVDPHAEHNARAAIAKATGAEVPA
jgi:hypothetical protein